MTLSVAGSFRACSLFLLAEQPLDLLGDAAGAVVVPAGEQLAVVVALVGLEADDAELVRHL